VDGRAIQQALVNLIDNALKHSPGGSTVTIGLKFPEPDAVPPVPGRSPVTASLPPSRRSIQLWVEDHGRGIPPEEHERIFERFYRCGSELRRETQGVGIGLSIVKHIVEAHGGRVLVRSAVGEGSRFSMELPMRNDTDLSDRCPAS
jgi:signal transduction histidine kinase